MPDTPPRPSRPAAPVPFDPADDATGLRSMRVDMDGFDDLSALAASLQATPPAVPERPVPTKPARQNSFRSTLIPPLLTGGLICEGLAVAWFCTDADSPYRRVSIALPIILIAAGSVLLLAAVINMTLTQRR